jgi:hypothetical protein
MIRAILDTSNNVLENETYISSSKPLGWSGVSLGWRVVPAEKDEDYLVTWKNVHTFASRSISRVVVDH